MRQITLNKGHESLIDDEDIEKVNKFRWYFDGRYVLGYTPMKKGKRQKVYLHRLIMNFPSLEVDHINCDKLDNRKENLRTVTHKQNLLTRKKANKKFKGVYWDKTRNKWAVAIRRNGIYKNFGRFKNEEEAAIKYNKIAVEYFGEFAYLNKI